jgi:hypothetical protein
MSHATIPKPHIVEGCITFREKEYAFKAFILPYHHKAHVSADSPRHGDIDRAAEIMGAPDLRDDDGKDCTGVYFQHKEQVKALILAEYAHYLVAKKAQVKA